MKGFMLLAGTALALPLAVAAETNAETENAFETEDRILVTADFRQAGLGDLSTSATVIDAETLRARNASHIDQVLNLAPNVNFSGGASRGRFFQIRGIGVTVRPTPTPPLTVPASEFSTSPT